MSLPSSLAVKVAPSEVILTPKTLREWARVAEQRGVSVVARVVGGHVTVGLTDH
jgi:propanediol dehydratase small subunit